MESNQIRSGQVCKVCGFFFFFDEDNSIYEYGLCDNCKAELDLLSEEENKLKAGLIKPFFGGECE